jgi:hypothetical protein
MQVYAIKNHKYITKQERFMVENEDMKGKEI